MLFYLWHHLPCDLTNGLRTAVTQQQNSNMDIWNCECAGRAHKSKSSHDINICMHAKGEKEISDALHKWMIEIRNLKQQRRSLNWRFNGMMWCVVNEFRIFFPRLPCEVDFEITTEWYQIGLSDPLFGHQMNDRSGFIQDFGINFDHYGAPYQKRMANSKMSADGYSWSNHMSFFRISHLIFYSLEYSQSIYSSTHKKKDYLELNYIKKLWTKLMWAFRAHDATWGRVYRFYLSTLVQCNILYFDSINALPFNIAHFVILYRFVYSVTIQIWITSYRSIDESHQTPPYHSSIVETWDALGKAMNEHVRECIWSNMALVGYRINQNQNQTHITECTLSLLPYYAYNDANVCIE